MPNPFALVPPEAVYIHVPFCLSKCTYCDFYSEKYSRSDLELYLSSLEKEMAINFAQVEQKYGKAAMLSRPLRSIYFGGGTPSLLEPEDIAEILNSLQKLPWAEDIEITLEANPASNLGRNLAAYHQLGINRLSLGLQTTRDDLLRKIGRLHNYEDFLQAYEAARQAGFKNISVDLIFALPGQTLVDFQKDLENVVALKPEHLSFYSLILEEDTPLGAYYLEHPEELVMEVEERKMYRLISKMLEPAGYNLYEISNAALPGFYSRHNSHYWQAKAYYAFGPAASSYIGGKRQTRIADINCWHKIIQETYGGAKNKKFPPEFYSFEENIDRNAARNEFMLLGFRLLRGISQKEFKEIFKEEMEIVYKDELECLLSRKLIEKTAEGYRLSLIGRDLANQVFMAFV